MPKVSVIIPTHNRANFLRGAVTSVLNQTFQDFEIIIIDDASEDQTREIAGSFRDQRIRYIRNDIARGQGATRNAGLRCAVGEYIALLDDDDEWMPQKLEKQIGVLDRSPFNVGMVYTGVSRIDAISHREINRVTPKKSGSLFRDLCEKNWIGGCSTVVLRRACLEKVGLFDEALAAQADYDLWLRISREFDIECIREPLVLYAVHSNRISTNYESVIHGMEAQLRKYGSVFARDKQNYSRRYLVLGINYCLNGNVRKGQGALLRAIRLYPLSVRPYYYLFLASLGTEKLRKWQHFRANYTLRRSPCLRAWLSSRTEFKH